jgi:hypothetical protein
MKNQPTKSKSTIIYILAACLVLAVLGPPAAELAHGQGSGRGSPPTPVDVTLILPGICGFDVQVEIRGMQGAISLPGGNFLVTSPGQFATFTNLSNPSKSMTLNVAGPGMVSTDENGNTIIEAHGHWGFFGPSLGIELVIGDFEVVLDKNGNVIQGTTGNGKIIDVCELIN